MSFSNRVKIFVLIVIGFFIRSEITVAQPEVYKSQATVFSSNKQMDFAPAYYKGGLVFCSDRKNVSFFSYHNDSSSLLSMFYTELDDSSQIGKVDFFADELTTQFNDGPACFSRGGDTIFFSRNTQTKLSVKSGRNSANTIGIFTAVKSKGKWKDVKPFPYNSQSYSIKAPSISSNGLRLYFSSNKPGGYGGFDLYYSDFIDNNWQEPINLGAIINTIKDESYPFIANDQKLYFSSNGHQSLGGLDIFYSKVVKGKWLSPVHLESDINSVFDDFALITTNNLHTGYFSTNRNGTDDIFSFKKNQIQFDDCKAQKENTFCYQFTDERTFVNDTLNVKYEWDFGDSNKVVGEKVSYCFPKEGSYSVILRIINQANGDTINRPEPFPVELKNREQAYINADTIGLVGEQLSFDGLESNLPDFFVSEYFWDFGEGFVHTGDRVTHSYSKEGEYEIKLGLVGSNTIIATTKICVTKKIRIKSNN